MGLQRAADNVVLNLALELDEVGRVARDTDQNVLVILRVLLCGAQRLGVDDVDLHMLTVLLKVTAEDGLQNVQTLLTLEQGRVEALVDQSAGLVHEQVGVCDGREGGGGAVRVSAAHRGGVVGLRGEGMAAVGHGTDLLAEGDVVGLRGHDDCVACSVAVIEAVILQLVAEPVGQLAGVIVDDRIVIAVLGRAVEQQLTHILVALEVAGQQIHQLTHGHVLVAEDTYVDRGEGVGNVSGAGDGADGEAVRRGALLQVLALIDAALREAGGRQRRQQVGVAGDDAGEDLQPGLRKVVQLGAEGSGKLIHGGEGPHVAGLQANLLLGDGIDAVVERDLEDLVGVEETDVRIFIRDAGYHVLHAAADAVFARLLDRVAHGQQIGNADVVVEERGVAVPLADALECETQGVAVDVVVVAEGHGRLLGGHLDDGVQHQIGQAVAGVLAILQLTAEEHVHPQRAAGVGLGLHRGTVDLQLGDLQLQLIDEVGHEVLAHAACEIGLLQRVHVLVEAAEAVVVAVAFEHKGEVGEFSKYEIELIHKMYLLYLF